MTDDLVSGVLTRIAEVERVAQAAFDEIEAALKQPVGEIDMVHPGQFEAWMEHANESRPSSILRLCRAHRQIVDEHASRHTHVEASGGGAWCADCGCPADQCTRRDQDVCERCGFEQCTTLRALAVGLGVLEDSDE